MRKLYLCGIVLCGLTAGCVEMTLSEWVVVTELWRVISDFLASQPPVV